MNHGIMTMSAREEESELNWEISLNGRLAGAIGEHRGVE
jgi:hypothetical protein